VQKVLVDCFNAKQLFCGDNFTFGARAAGNVERLRELCAPLGIGVHIVPMAQYGGQTVSSTRIRAALEEGKTLAVPLCMGPGMMQARAVRSLEELAPAGPYGIPEPPAGAPEVPPQRLALCVLPCLAAAPDGTRLGYGGGYYDRFLPLACNAVKIALCRAVLLEPVLPRECHDVRADFVLTEDALYACKGGG